MWRIVAMTGLPGVLSLLFLVPIANIIMLFVLVFSKWPVQKELKKAKSGTS